MFTFDPLESAPPRPWNSSDTPTYIPRRHYMTSPTSELPSTYTEPTARRIKHPKPTKSDPTRTKPEVNPEKQSQQVNSLVKDILRHHYKDDPFFQDKKSDF